MGRLDSGTKSNDSERGGQGRSQRSMLRYAAG